MATNKNLDKLENEKPGRVRKTQTVRDRSKQEANDANKPRRIRKVSTKVSGGFRKRMGNFGRFLMKEYYLPMPNNKAGTFLNKRRSPAPTYFIGAFKELRQVSWPGRKETTKLTIAVFIFAFTFGLIVAAVDYGLDQLFKKVIL